MRVFFKPWMRRTLIGLAGATLLLGGLSACGHHPHRGGWGAMSEADTARLRERFIERASKELQLDEAQKAKLAQLADAMKAQRDALRGPVAAAAAGGGDARADARAEVAALIAGSSFDRARAQALIDAKTGAVREKSPAVVGAAGEFFDSLKPEQQQKVREFLQRGASRWGRG